MGVRDGRLVGLLFRYDSCVHDLGGGTKTEPEPVAASSLVNVLPYNNVACERAVTKSRTDGFP